MRLVASICVLVFSCAGATAVARPRKSLGEYAVFVRVVGPDASGEMVPIAGASVRAYPSTGEPDVTTDANGEAAREVADTAQGGDYVHIVVSANGYRRADMRYLLDQHDAAKVLRNRHLSAVELVNFLTGHKDRYTTIALTPGEEHEAAGDEVQMTVEVKDADLAPVPGALVQFCCSTDGRVWYATTTDNAGESTYGVPRPWIESGLQLRATAPDGPSRYSDVPTSVLDEAGPRLFLITLPKKAVTHQWAGDWKDSFGGFGLRWLPWQQYFELPKQPGHAQLWDKLNPMSKRSLCPAGADYYEGGYYDPPGDAGMIVACAAHNGKELIGRYLSEYDGHGGTFTITLASSEAWSGTYQDDGKTVGHWSGTFEKHFEGDGATETQSATPPELLEP